MLENKLNPIMLVFISLLLSTDEHENATLSAILETETETETERQRQRQTERRGL